jgi:hypothetical protein
MIKYNVVIKDLNGELLFKFDDVKPVVKAETITVTGNSFQKNQIIELNCVATNVLKGELFPEPEPIEEAEEIITEPVEEVVTEETPPTE